MHPCAIAPDLSRLIGPSTVPALTSWRMLLIVHTRLPSRPSRLLTWTAPRSVILLALTSRRGGTDEFLGAGFSDSATLRLWQMTRGQTLHTCLVQLRADTVRWKVSGAAKRDRVNSIRGVTFMKKKNLRNSVVRLLTSEAIYVVKWAEVFGQGRAGPMRRSARRTRRGPGGFKRHRRVANRAPRLRRIAARRALWRTPSNDNRPRQTGLVGERVANGAGIESAPSV